VLESKGFSSYGRHGAIFGGVPDVVIELFMRFKINRIETHKPTSGTLPLVG
jgi:hypothetical protein